MDAVVPLDDLTGRLHDEVLRVAHAHGVHSIAVFGSVARGDASSDSDVDFLGRIRGGPLVLDLLRLTDDLEALLGCAVDVVSAGGLNVERSQLRLENVGIGDGMQSNRVWARACG